MQRVTIERLGHKGDGIAPGPVHVPRVLPGEVVEGQVTDGRMDSPRIVLPSTERVRPPCAHYKGCGGCAVQHATDAFVAAWKSAQVESALAARGITARVRKLHASGSGTRRRAALSGIRTKSGALVGFHGRASGNVVATDSCLVLDQGILAAFPALRALTELGASRKGEIRLTVIRGEAGVDVAVTDAKPMEPALWSAAVALAEAHDLPRLTWNGDIVVERRPPVLAVGPARVVPPPGAFLQATAEGEAALLSCVREALGPARAVVDLFAGLGTFALPLAAAARVHAVEGDAALLGALDRGWRHAEGLRQVSTEVRDLFRRPLEPGELAAFDGAVIDPPRAGAEAQMARLAAGGPARLAMVSCNPVTFARDAEILISGGYALEWVDVIDQFRWSSHVEIAAALTR